MTLSPQEAQERLEQSIELETQRDRTFHALSLAGMGLLMSFGYVTYHLTPDGSPWDFTTRVISTGGFLAIAAWWAWGATVIPRHAQWIGLAGVAFSLAALMVTHGWANWVYRDTDHPAWVVTIGAIAVALPLLLSALFVMLRGKK